MSQTPRSTLLPYPGTLRSDAGSVLVISPQPGSGINVKIRALADGVNSITMQLDQALKAAHDMKPDKPAENKP